MLVNKLQLKDRNNINGIIRHDSFFLKLNLFQFSTNVNRQLYQRDFNQ